MQKKTIIIITAISMVFFNVYSQDTTRTRTLLHLRKINYLGVYGDVNLQYGQIQNEFTPIGGASVMILFNKRFGAGVTMQQSLNRGFSPSDVSPLYLRSGFGGLKLEYITNPSAVVHFSFPLIVGMGMAYTDSSIHYRTVPLPFGYRENNVHEHYANRSTFFIVQPGIQIETNLLKYLKLYAGVNYRFSFATRNANDLPSNTLQGFAATVGLKIGLFEIATRKKQKTTSLE